MSKFAQFVATGTFIECCLQVVTKVWSQLLNLSCTSTLKNALLQYIWYDEPNDRFSGLCKGSNGFTSMGQLQSLHKVRISGKGKKRVSPAIRAKPDSMDQTVRLITNQNSDLLKFYTTNYKLIKKTKAFRELKKPTVRSNALQLLFLASQKEWLSNYKSHRQIYQDGRYPNSMETKALFQTIENPQQTPPWHSHLASSNKRRFYGLNLREEQTWKGTTPRLLKLAVSQSRVDSTTSCNRKYRMCRRQIYWNKKRRC